MSHWLLVLSWPFLADDEYHLRDPRKLFRGFQGLDIVWHARSLPGVGGTIARCWALLPLAFDLQSAELQELHHSMA